MSLSINPLRWSLPVKLIAIIILVLAFGDHVSQDVKQILLALSLTLQELLVFALPVIIFSYLSSCLLSFKKGALAFISILLVITFVSNFISIIIGYGGSIFILDKINTSADMSAISTKILIPMWSFSLPEYLSTRNALFLGLAVGLIFSFRRSQTVEKITSTLKTASTFFLSKMFIPLVPLFILGLVFKLEFEGTLKLIAQTYAPVFVFANVITILYIVILFGFSVKFNLKAWYEAIKLPFSAAIMGFGSMSSAAAMPLTLLAAEKNTQNPAMARAIIPATVNIHMIGNTMIVAVLALSMMLTYGYPFPDFSTYLMFAFSFALASFAVAAVPSGGILVVISILQKTFGFSSEMTSLLIPIYMLFDASIAATNILGNSVFAIILNKLYKKLKIGND